MGTTARCKFIPNQLDKVARWNIASFLIIQPPTKTSGMATLMAMARPSSDRRRANHDGMSSSTNHTGWKIVRVNTTAVPTAAMPISVKRGDRGRTTTSHITMMRPHVVGSSYVGVKAPESTCGSSMVTVAMTTPIKGRPKRRASNEASSATPSTPNPNCST